jgi:LuxR family maltose regulon positive regulatory protein
MVETSTRIHLPIIRSKLNPPVGGRHLVVRDRLNGWLETDDLPRVILARAPAGFGKTTLMVQWYRMLQQRGAQVAWISLEEPENDPGQFLAYLVASLQMGIPGLGLAESVSDPLGSGGGTMGTILYLVDKLSAAPDPFTLFLDDFDVIANEAVLKLVQQLINYLPLGKRLVIGLRQSPALGLVKMQATGELLEVGVDDLRFTREESGRFLRQVPDIALDEQDIETIQGSMEGWIAGLQLTTISPWRENPKSLVRKQLGAFGKISLYLAEDVLSRQPEEVETFLLQTSVLNRLCGPLCNAVTGRSDSYRMLDHLERANLFIVPLDEERRWYRYHNLFAKFLRNRLERKGEDQIRKLHALAAQWYLQEGNYQEAAQHALEASDFDAAAEMIDRCAVGMMESGFAATIIKWGQTIPLPVLARYHELACTYIYSLIFEFQYEQATAVIDRVTEIWSTTPGKEALVESLRPMRAQILIFTDQVDECERVVDDDQWQGDEHGAPDRVTLLTRGAVFNIACVVKTSAGKFEEALKYYSRGAAIGRRIEMLTPEPLIHNIYNKWALANLEFTQGRLQEALGILQAVQERIENGPARYSIAGAAISVTKAEILYEMNEVEEAERLLHSFRSVLEVTSPPDGLIIALRTLARIHASRGEWTTASNYLTDLERLGLELDIARCGATARLERSRMSVVRGNVEEAVQISRNSDDGEVWRRFASRCMRANDPETPELCSLRILIAKGQARESIETLKAATRAADTSGRKRQSIISRLLLAKAYEGCGERRSALRTLRETVILAHGSGFIRSFIDEGEPVRALLRELQGATPSSGQGDNEELPPEYLHRILQGFGGVDSSPREASECPPHLQDDLTDREIAIVEQLAKGLSNEEIADKLFISVHTVRSHLRNIHAKLGATNRTQAVALARSYGLIQ